MPLESVNDMSLVVVRTEGLRAGASQFPTVE